MAYGGTSGFQSQTAKAGGSGTRQCSRKSPCRSSAHPGKCSFHWLYISLQVSLIIPVENQCACIFENDMGHGTLHCALACSLLFRSGIATALSLTCMRQALTGKRHMPLTLWRRGCCCRSRPNAVVFIGNAPIHNECCNAALHILGRLLCVVQSRGHSSHNF